MQLLWEEYREANPEGYRYSRFCELYQRAYYKALKELRILQTNRAFRARKIAPEELIAIPAITDIN